MNTYAYVEGNPLGFVDPYGLASKVATLIRLTSHGFKKLARLDKKQAIDARKSGKNVLADSRQTARQIEQGAHGKSDLLRHKGHDLNNGSKGNPHYQTNGAVGHTFWSSAFAGIAVGLDYLADIAEIIDPFTYITSGDNYNYPPGYPPKNDAVCNQE